MSINNSEVPCKHAQEGIRREDGLEQGECANPFDEDGLREEVFSAASKSIAGIGTE
jgi:hypothetical protein